MIFSTEHCLWDLYILLHIVIGLKIVIAVHISIYGNSNLFIHSTIEVHLNGFQVCSMMNILIHVSLYAHINISIGYISENALTELWGTYILKLVNAANIPGPMYQFKLYQQCMIVEVAPFFPTPGNVSF